MIRRHAIITITRAGSSLPQRVDRLTDAATIVMGTGIIDMEAGAIAGTGVGPITAGIPVTGILTAATTAIANHRAR